jgi:hypothetical protein
MEPIIELLTEIARERLGIETLDTRRSDSLDFHEVSVWGVKNALWHAYQAGANASPGSTAAPPQYVWQQMRRALQMASNYMADNLDETDEAEMRVFDAIRSGLDAANATIPSAPTAPSTSDTGLPSCFDDYEIHGIFDFDEDDRTFSEQVPDDEARYWSLFGHIPGRGLECIGDFESRKLAERIYARITGRRYGSKS